jgi:shikimate dehydrogenase
MAPPKIYGLVGYPVKHSLSPLMHNAVFQALAINAEYRLFEVRPGQLERFFDSLSQENISGLNVTIPYKEKVIPLLDNLSKEASLVGAVNTVRIENNKLEGFNTDGEGFLRHLNDDLKFNPQGKIIAIIGAGGASRAVCVYLAREGPREITVYDIEKTKAELLVAHLKKHFNNLEFRQANSLAELNIRNCDLLLNATPVGMKETDPCVIDENFMHNNLLVYDLIYNPKETKLLKIARIKGARTSNGLGMLLHQGALCFEIWTGQKAPIEIMRSALNEGVKKLCSEKF